MKTRYALNILFAILHFGFLSCDSDDDEVQLLPEMALDQKEVKLMITQTAEVNISGGGGEYDVYVADDSVADATLNGTIVTITSKKLGVTDVIISDQNDSFQKLTVYSCIGETKFDRSDFNFKIKLGNPEKFRFKITEGNTAYRASTEDVDIMEVKSYGDEIVLTAKQEGNASLIVTDLLGLETVVPVTVTSTTIPFTSEDLEEIKANEKNRYELRGENMDYDWVRYFNTKDENGLNHYGWEYYSSMYFKISFSGDKSVGVKTGSRLATKLDWDEPETDDEINLEIIKNNGTKIWAVFSFVKDEKLIYGHFCQNIADEDEENE